MPAANPLAAEWEAEYRRLTRWLASLAEFADQAPPHVVERVRADYLDRIAELAGRAGVHAARLRAALLATRERMEAATEHRLELRLRYLVGEIEPAVLDAGLDEQEAVIAAATAEQASLEAEQAGVEQFVDTLRVQHPQLRVPDDPPGSEVRVPGATGEDDLAFLESLPASPIAGGAPPEAPRPASTATGSATAPGRAEPESRSGGMLVADAAVPRSVLSCRHCGTANDPSLWYCDGCGAELA